MMPAWPIISTRTRIAQQQAKLEEQLDEVRDAFGGGSDIKFYGNIATRYQIEVPKQYLSGGNSAVDREMVTL